MRQVDQQPARRIGQALHVKAFHAVNALVAPVAHDDGQRITHRPGARRAHGLVAVQHWRTVGAADLEQAQPVSGAVELELHAHIFECQLSGGEAGKAAAKSSAERVKR